MIQKENIIITGEWDGEPIMRQKTAHERLVGILKERWLNKQNKKVDNLLDNNKK